MISQKVFTDRILAEWYTFRGEERQRIQKILLNFDENGDGVF